MEKNNYSENTGELLTKAAAQKKKAGAKYIAAAALLVAVIAGVAGVLLHGNSQYNKQIDLALGYLEEGNYEQAEIEYAAAVAMKPRRVEAREGLAYTRAAAGKYDLARQTYEELYNDTKDEKYLEAIEAVTDGAVPANPELDPRKTGHERPGDRNADAEKISTSNAGNGGRVCGHGGKIYYVSAEEQYGTGADDSYEGDNQTGVLYVAEPDGSDLQEFYYPGEDTGITGAVYDDGTLYVLQYYQEAPRNRSHTLVALDPETGEVLRESEVLGTVLCVYSFFVEDKYAVFEVGIDGENDYLVSVNMDTGEEIILSDYSTEWDGSELTLEMADSVSAYCDGWVYSYESIHLSGEDIEDYKYVTRMVRIRPDGTGREELFSDPDPGSGLSYDVDDVSVYDGVCSVIGVLGEIGAGSNKIIFRKLDTSDMTETRTEIEFGDEYLYNFNNSDGGLYYCMAYDFDGSSSYLTCYDTASGTTEKLLDLTDYDIQGLYSYGDYIYVYYRNDIDDDYYYTELMIVDKRGNVIRTIS